jgi:hypothetical protein
MGHGVPQVTIAVRPARRCEVADLRVEPDHDVRFTGEEMRRMTRAVATLDRQHGSADPERWGPERFPRGSRQTRAEWIYWWERRLADAWQWR